MKLLAACALALLSALPAQAQDRDAERARIKTERAAADARFADQKKACNAVFAVTDCVKKATREHNQVIGNLRRQERVLNDAERRERAADRLKEQEERNSPEARRQAEERRLRGLQEQKEREARAAAKSQHRAEQEAERAAKPRRAVTLPGPVEPQGKARATHAPKTNAPTAEEAARNREAYTERVLEAERHKAEVRERIARRSKPAASALPAPK
jgi:colicin import membrane protein